MLLTLRGIPQIYYSDEIGMQGGDDPDNRRDFPGGFPADPHNAFVASGRTPDEQEIFAHVQELLELRQSHPASRHGYQWHIAWDDTFYAFVRETSEEKLLVIFNSAVVRRDVTLRIDGGPLQDTRRLDKLFGSGQAQVQQETMLISIPATSLSVYRVE